jgi:hypothetical protein
MKFAALCALPYDAGTDRIDIESLRTELPDIPNAVLVQFCADHGRNSEFQKQYGHLDLGEIAWTLRSTSAREICECSMNEVFRSWFEEVSQRAAQFPRRRWACIDVRREVQEHWRSHATWIESPVMIDGSLVGPGSALHLVEGHTRVGLLAGLVQRSIVAPESIHSIWLGEIVDQREPSDAR